MLAGIIRFGRRSSYRDHADHIDLLDLGDAARDKGDYQSAAKHYAAGLEVRANAWPYRIQLGHCLKEIGDLDGALNSYLAAYEVAAHDPDLNVQLGHISRLRNDDVKARVFYLRAIELGSEDIHAIAYLKSIDLSELHIQRLRARLIQLAPPDRRASLSDQLPKSQSLPELILNYTASLSL